MSRRDRILYLLNATVLFAHEIDSAYWHEWDLFGLPGGIQLFLALNAVLILYFLYGYDLLLRGRRGGYRAAFLLAAAGVFAFTIHTVFLLCGDPAFRLPLSLLLLLLAFFLSLAQAYYAQQTRRRLVPRTH